MQGEAGPDTAMENMIATPSEGTYTTSILLSNLHCPSCVSNIEDTLSTLHPRPLSVLSSIVSSWVTVTHKPALSVKSLLKALQDIGFDICSVLVDSISQEALDASMKEIQYSYSCEVLLKEGDGFLDRAVGQWHSVLSTKALKGEGAKNKAKHIQFCDLCQAEERKALNENSSVSQSPFERVGRDAAFKDWERGENATSVGGGNISIGGGRGPQVGSSKRPQGDINQSDPSFVVVDRGLDADIWRAVLAVGGMTCASCVNAIREELEKKGWVKKVIVNLISQSATVEITGKGHVNEIAEAIRDLGYEAALQDVQPAAQPNEMSSRRDEHSPPRRRTVEIKVTGMFCPRCPSRLLSSLKYFAERVVVEKSLGVNDPILKISYTPDAPHFTIRDIIRTLSAVDPMLEPSIYRPPTLEERSRILHTHERWRVLKRMVLSIIVAIPTFIIGILYMSLVPPTDKVHQYLSSLWIAGVSRTQWALFILATPVYFLAADVFHRRALKEVSAMWRRGSKMPLLQRFYRFGSMNMLMSLGTSIAYFSSVSQLIVAGTNPKIMADNTSFYFDSVVFLTLFLLIGRLIEAYSKSRTGDAVIMLGRLRPTQAILIADEKDSDSRLSNISVDLLEVGDTVRVLQGASPPCDGVVIDGATTFDESSLTGESRLVKKVLNDQVYAGAINKTSPISIRITGVTGSSMIDGIIQAVRDGQTRPAPIERIADTLTRHFVPVITLIALLAWVVWLSLGLSGALPADYLDSKSGGWIVWSLQFAIAVFVVACPCGLGLAAPTALYVGGGLAAQHGILVKGGGEAFEKASRLDCIVFDKTGTLTLGGEPLVTDYKILQQEQYLQDENMILSMIQKLEENSSHIIAKAIVSFCKSRGLNGPDIRDVEEIPGKGMKGLVPGPKGGIMLIAGNEALMDDYHVNVPGEIATILNAWKFQGKSIVLAATKLTQDESPIRVSTIFGISDAIRPEAPGLIKALQQRGTAVWMLSGDNYSTASAIGAQVGIPSSNIIAGVLPSQKADKIQYLQKSLKATTKRGQELTSRRALVAMVGDGINDAPALATADVGIAIGSGSDIAISSAEFVLVSSNLNALITLLDLSVLVFQRIKFNFAWALVYNMIGVPVAAGVLYPVVDHGNHIRLDPVWASLAMALSSISVVCSSLALRSQIPGVGFRNQKW